MADSAYFNKFPIINYANTYAVDITKRVAVINRLLQNPYVFYPFDISYNERPDQFSYRYYDDQYKSWIIYLGNKITDPYYEWYMSEKQLQDFLQKKYNSTYNAYEKVKFYRNNWSESENISVSRYDSLPITLKSYWTPVFFEGRITEYSRKQIELKVNTNRIISYGVSNTSFVVDEICTINFDGTNVGRGQIMGVGSNNIYIQHTSGTTLTSNTVSITGSSYIYGSESQVNTIFTSANLVVSNLDAEEEVYYSPVTYFDYENEKNEFNKSILVLDKNFSYVAVKNLTDLLKV